MVSICKGMVYLEGKNVIHRDLAARNILVSLTFIDFLPLNLATIHQQSLSWSLTFVDFSLTLMFDFC